MALNSLQWLICHKTKPNLFPRCKNKRTGKDFGYLLMFMTSLPERK